MSKLQQQSEKPSFEKVWLMFQETKELLTKTSLETNKKFLETNKKIEETSKQQKETDRQLKELGKQIGGLGNKFGSFNEGLFFPSLIKILKTKFNCPRQNQNYKFDDNGNSFEVDLLGISSDTCYIVEIKSHIREDIASKLIQKIQNFKKHADEYSGFTVYGIIAATHYNEEDYKRIINSGLYFISTSDDIAKLKMPSKFKPQSW